MLFFSSLGICLIALIACLMGWFGNDEQVVSIGKFFAFTSMYAMLCYIALTMNSLLNLLSGL